MSGIMRGGERRLGRRKGVVRGDLFSKHNAHLALLWKTYGNVISKRGATSSFSLIRIT
jgi:hypothetical protein